MKNDFISYVSILRIPSVVPSKWEVDLFSLLVKHQHTAGSFTSINSAH